MTHRLGTCSILAVALLAAGVALGQNNQPWQSPQPAMQSQQPAPRAQAQPAYPPPYGQPDQGYPPAGTQPRPAQPGPGQPMAAQPARAPAAPPWWPLPRKHQDYIDQVLRAWEAHGDRVEMFESEFVKRVYEPDWESRQPGAMKLKSTDVGIVKYKKPDKGLFEIIGDPNLNPKENENRAEKWICDGHSFYHYDFTKKQLTEEPLPSNMLGKALGEGPVPFVFGAKAKKMKDLYWIRWLPPPQGVTDQIYLEVWPRRQKDAADFRRAEVILSAKDMRPIGIRLYLPAQRTIGRDGQVHEQRANHETFTFDKTVINPTDLLKFLKGDPFTARIDRGWKKVVEPAQTGQASRQRPVQ